MFSHFIWSASPADESNYPHYTGKEIYIPGILVTL